MEIADIKGRLPILTVLAHYQLQPNKNNLLTCPFHDDATASLQIYPNTNTYHCFACGKTGDVIQFIEDHEKCSKHEAILKAQSMIGSTVPEQVQLQAGTKPEENYPELFLQFKAALPHSPKAMAYCKQRGLENLTELGYNPGTTFTKLRYCLTFPLKDKEGNITSLYGRNISQGAIAKHFYTAARQGLYQGYPGEATETLIITEAIIDAATLLQIPEIAAHYQILASYGTNGFTHEHKEAVKALPNLKEIIIFFDGDTPGQESASLLAENLHELLPCNESTGAVPCVSIVETPKEEDINSIYLKYGAETILELINKRTNLFSSFEPSLTEPKNQQATVPIEPLNFEPQNPERLNPKPSNNLDTTNPLRITYTTATALYIVKGGIQKQPDSLKISLDVAHVESGFKYRTKLDLYEDKQVRKESREASEKLDLRADLIEKDLSYLTDHLEHYRNHQEQQPRGRNHDRIIIPEPERQKCLDFLNKPDLLNLINEMLGQTGITGEENARLFLFIIAASHKMPDTLHALIQGSSGSGKTRLLRKISDCMPQENVICYTRVTESSFYNYDEYYFENKLVCFEDVDGLKEEALFAVRELISNEKLTSSTTVKSDNGQLNAVARTVRGPIASISCTTRGEIYEDNMSRIFIVAVDESREQTGRVISYQNKKAAGQIDDAQERKIREFLQNCVRLLNPYQVINPYADKLLLPENAHKIRRLTELYHAFVKQVTLINQYQRKKDKQNRLITEPQDLQTACEIMFDSIMLKVDELDGSLRQFFERLKAYVKSQGSGYEKYEFTQREARFALFISKSQLQRFINTLQGLEYIQQTSLNITKGNRYKIVWWDNYTVTYGNVREYLQNQIKGLLN
jgi:DNA primase/ABC-type dipeptide/oligopeptide/nickel transport system ATPase component